MHPAPCLSPPFLGRSVFLFWLLFVGCGQKQENVPPKERLTGARDSVKTTRIPQGAAAVSPTKRGERRTPPKRAPTGEGGVARRGGGPHGSSLSQEQIDTLCAAQVRVALACFPLPKESGVRAAFLQARRDPRKAIRVCQAHFATWSPRTRRMVRCLARAEGECDAARRCRQAEGGGIALEMVEDKLEPQRICALYAQRGARCMVESRRRYTQHMVHLCREKFPQDSRFSALVACVLKSTNCSAVAACHKRATAEKGAKGK